MNRTISILSPLFFALFLPGAAMSPSNAASKCSDSVCMTGRTAFAVTCAGCHDANSARVVVGPGLKGYYQTHQPRPTDEGVRQIIQSGKGAMPAFPSIDKRQLDDLIAYLRSL